MSTCSMQFVIKCTCDCCRFHSHNDVPHVAKRTESIIVHTWERRLSLCIYSTVKILKIGTPEIITIIVLQLEQLDFTVQYCVQKMQTE